MNKNKIVNESLESFLNEAKLFKGQVETGLSIDDVDEREFLIGIEIEKKHSNNLSVQEELVFQNLSKDRKYYTKGIKRGLFSEPSALNLYKKYFIDRKKS